MTKNYDAFTEAADAFVHRKEGNMRDVKKKLFLAMHNVNILKDCVSCFFACTFAFAESKVMEGSAKIIH